MDKFIRSHLFPSIGLLLGPFIAVLGLVLHGYELFEIAPKWLILAVGGTIFGLSFIGLGVGYYRTVKDAERGTPSISAARPPDQDDIANT